MYDKVAKSPMARRQLLHCGDSLDLKEEVLEDLFKFTRHVTQRVVLWPRPAQQSGG